MKKRFGLLVLVSSLLLVACESRNHNSNVPHTNPSQSVVKDIGGEKAKQIVLDYLGHNEQSVTNLMVEESLEDSRKVYEIDFTVDGKRYGFEVDAATGHVLKTSSEISEALVETAITESQAKEIVLADMGVKESELTSLRVTQDKEDARLVYEVAIIYSNTEYDYVVDAESGNILEKEVETLD